MAEPYSEASRPHVNPASPEQIAEVLDQTDTFLRDVAPHLGRLFGMDLHIQVGNSWATDMESGTVTADPRFFIERGYTPDMSAYATLHEVAAHLREVVNDPRTTAEVINFKKEGQPQSVFHNIFADIAGNNLIHAALPRMKDVAIDLYRDKLFEDTDYRTQPRHLQFLYKIIRQEMVPGYGPIEVLPEVDEAIGSLRDYQGQGDLIKYSTAVAKSAREVFTPKERFKIWKSLIYPVYEELLEQDREDPDMQSSNSNQSNPDEGEGSDEGSENQPQASSSEGKPAETDTDPSNEQDGQPTDGSSDDQKFGDYYDDYHQNRHPEPMTPEEEEQFHKDVLQAQRPEPNRQERPQDWLNQEIKNETGHTLNEQRNYNAEILKWQESIEAMREVYRSVINERVAQKRGLSRRTFSEGAVLDPDRLVQTVIDVRNNIEDPEAFRDYEQRRGENKALGKTDYIFLFDVSGSMEGEKAKAAATSAVIGMEGLGALQRDIEDAERENGMDLELDIRTAIYTFGENVHCLKPLSTKVQPKERLDTYDTLRSPQDKMTRDFLAIEEIEKLPDETDRRRIVIVVSDGETYDPITGGTSARTRSGVDRLRGKGWFVYGISIGSDEAEDLYKPTARRVDDPTKLPKTIQGFIESTIS